MHSSRGGVCLLGGVVRGVLPSGGSAWPMALLKGNTHHPVNKQTAVKKCENIKFLQIRLRAVKILNPQLNIGCNLYDLLQVCDVWG